MFVIVYCMLRLYNNKDHMVYVIYVLLYIKLGFATHFDYTGKINIVCFEEQWRDLNIFWGLRTPTLMGGTK